MLISNIDGRLNASHFDAGSNSVQIDIKNTLHFIKDYSLMYEDLLLNAMDFYNVSSNVTNGKVRFINFTMGGNITKAKPDNCAWEPNGKVGTNSSTIDLCPANVQIEHCHGLIECWRELFGTGNQVTDPTATEFGQLQYRQLLELVFKAIGNDFYKINWFGRNELMLNAAAQTLGQTNPDQYNELKKTLDTCGGWTSIIDYYQSQGIQNFACNAINSDNVSGGKFLGDIIEVFKKMVECASPAFKAAMKTRQVGGADGRACMLVTPDLYDAYKEYLLQRYNTIPDIFHFSMNGEFCAKIGCGANSRMDGALLWDNIWIKCMDSWAVATSEMAINHTRAILTLPKNLALGVDVGDSGAGNGMGFSLFEDKENPKFRGKLFGETNYQLGTGIIFRDFIVNSSIIY
jgi:hypothetical protein